MPRQDIINDTRIIAGELAKAGRTRRIASRNEIAILGLLDGALYGILRAAELDYDDARRRPDPASHLIEFGQVAGAIAHGAALPAVWIAGYHFGNALIRLDSVRERLQVKPDSHELYDTVRRAANNLKHVPPATMIAVAHQRRRQQRFDAILPDAVQVARMLIQVFVAQLEPIAS